MPAKRPRVILNDRALFGPRTGVGHYIAELTAAIGQVDPEINLLAVYQTYFPRRRSKGPFGLSRASAGGPCRRWPWWLRRMAQGTYKQVFKATARLKKCTLYHEPNHIPMPWHGPTITTIHDLSVIRHPEWHPDDRVRWYEQDFNPSLSLSEHFITVSQFSKQEMVELGGIDPQRITPIALAPRAAFYPRPQEEINQWLIGNQLPTEYLIYVGTIEPRKNVEGTLAAYAQLPSTTRKHIPMLIAGAVGWQRESMKSLIEKHRLTQQVRVLGYLNDEALASLYAGARALVWPTLYEGFGLPPLECMASGTPVITSNLSSIPEVTGDAAILIDPADTVQISDAIQKVLEDKQLVQSLTDKGLERSKMFSWARCAAEHATLYRRFSAD
ncbi:MAG: glycosyltransferase family 4 protein [Planctomycetota bacterium]|nr:MAG: glycosyltransferase family 4 protein [Planctomycetota bacterium]